VITLKNKFMKKSVFRIVPTTTEALGNCWAIKDGDTVVGTYINKQLAEEQKKKLESLSYNFFKTEIEKTYRLDIKF